jgi:hypothetical protein
LTARKGRAVKPMKRTLTEEFSVEYRDDLEQVLLDGFSETERHHIESAMVTNQRDQLYRKRHADGSRRNQMSLRAMGAAGDQSV